MADDKLSKQEDNRPDPPSAKERPSEKELEKAQEIRAKIEELKAQAAELEGAELPEDDGEIVANVVRNVPNFEVEVNDGNVCSHGDEDYHAGDTFVADGPTAMSLASLGHVTIKGVAA